MIKNWKKFNEDIDNNDFDDDFDDIKPIGIDELESQGTNGLVYICPLENDVVSDWNNDEQIKKFVDEGRLFLSEVKYDEWGIYAVEGDREVKSYIVKNYSW